MANCCIAQLDSLGKGNSEILNSHELKYLDSLLNHFDDMHFDFKNLKIIYVGDDSLEPIISKKDFFSLYIAPFASKGEVPHFKWKFFTEKERKKARGYDGMIKYRPVFSDKEIYRMLKKRVKK
jgi:hypothetical protein